jgi:tetratricopeptide (TPR) repeat protein
LTAGRPEEAVLEVGRAVELDPLSVRTYTRGTLFLIFARRYDEAIALARKGQDLDPSFPFTVAWAGVAQAEQRRFREAVGSLQKALRLSNHPAILSLGAHVHAVAGERVEAQTLIQRAEEAAEHRYFCPYEIGTAYVSLGDADTAFRWFRKGVEDRADCMAWLDVEPWIAPFRSDPRYGQLLRDVGLAPRASAAAPR